MLNHRLGLLYTNIESSQITSQQVQVPSSPSHCGPSPSQGDGRPSGNVQRQQVPNKQVIAALLCLYDCGLRLRLDWLVRLGLLSRLR